MLRRLILYKIKNEVLINQKKYLNNILKGKKKIYYNDEKIVTSMIYMSWRHIYYISLLLFSLKK